MPSNQEMTGLERAAVLLLNIGEENAAEVFKHLEPMEVQSVGAAISGLSSITDDKVVSVVDEFTDNCNQSDGLAGTDEFVKNVLQHALGEDKAKSMIGRILESTTPKGLETLKWMDPTAVANILRDEHPQICAIVLLSLEAEHAAQILKLIEDEKQSEIMIRVAGLNTVKPDALEELDELMRKQLMQHTPPSASKVDGIRSAAQILNFMDSTNEANILEEIEDADEDMCEAIREKMFIFENLMVLEDKDMQRLLREVETETLVLSLKAAEESVRGRFFGNMSKRAAELLREDIEMRGPLKLSEVEASQKEVLTIAARLSDEGEINMRSKGDEEYV